MLFSNTQVVFDLILDLLHLIIFHNSLQMDKLQIFHGYFTVDGFVKWKVQH